MSRFIPLQDDNKAYNEAFNAYMSRSNKTELTRQFIQEELSQYMQRFYDTDELEEVDSISMLSIGAGTGVKDVFFIDELRKIYPNKVIKVVVLEPNKDNMKDYQKSMKKKDYGKSVEFTWRIESSQQFQAMSTGTKKFDLIVSLEAMYYEDDVVKGIEFYMKTLTDRGVFFITINTSGGSWNKINRELKFYTGKVVGSDDIRQALNMMVEKRQLKFHESTSINRFEIDCMFDATANAEGDAIADFLSHAANYRQNATPEEFAKFLELAKTCCVKEEESGQLLWNMDVAMFVVSHHC